LGDVLARVPPHISHVLVNLHHDRHEQAIIKSITPTTGGKKFQVDFGNNETALVLDWQIMEKI